MLYSYTCVFPAMKCSNVCCKKNKQEALKHFKFKFKRKKCASSPHSSSEQHTLEWMCGSIQIPVLISDIRYSSSGPLPFKRSFTTTCVFSLTPQSKGFCLLYLNYARPEYVRACASLNISREKCVHTCIYTHTHIHTQAWHISNTKAHFS